MVIGVAFGLMSVLFLAGLYVAGAMGVLALVMMYFFSDAPLWNIMSSTAWATNTNFILVSIPLFVLMGDLALRAGFAERMYSAFSRWVSLLPGGLIHTNIASCAVFAACSGHSVATAATISRVSLPSFRARGYNERLVLGSLAAGGTLGILIPPSVPMVLYALTVGESVGRLFLAGFIPGFMLAFVFMIMIGVIAAIRPSIAPREQGASLFDLPGWWERIAATVSIIPIFVLIFIVLGSMYLGWATPTEAAAWGVSGVFVMAVLNNSGPALRSALRGKLHQQQVKEAVQVNLKMLYDAVLSTMRTTGMIFLILVAAFSLSFAFGILGMSSQMASWVSGFHLTPVELVIVLVLFYLLLGTFMESHAMLLTTVPILAPVLRATGVDLLWFGIIMVILLEVALISPPEGMNLYVLHNARQEASTDMAQGGRVKAQTGTIGDVWIGVLPFMVCMMIVMALIIAFPEIALWLPDLVKGAR